MVRQSFGTKMAGTLAINCRTTGHLRQLIEQLKINYLTNPKQFRLCKGHDRRSFFA